MNRPTLSPALVRLLSFGLALAVLVALLVTARRIFLPLLLGLAFAYLLDPAVSWFERRGRSRAFGTVAITLAAVLLVALILLLVVPILVRQVTELGQRLPTYEAQVEAKVRPILERLQAQYPEQFDTIRLKAEETVREKWPQMLQGTVSWLGNVFSSFLNFLLFILDLVFVPVFAFYLLIDFPKLKRGIVNLVPVPYRPRILERVGEVNQVVSSFLRGQLVIALILAAINGIGLTLLGVPMGLLLGIIAGLANMIPYMALVVGLAPALLLSWIESQSLATLVGVVLVFSAAQLLEGTFLSPRILSKSVDLHPVWVLLAIIVGGRLFGVVGMLVAVPAAAAIQVFIRHWLVAYRSSSVFLGDETSGEGAKETG